MAVKHSENPQGSKVTFNYILMGILVVAAFIIGSLYQKVKTLEKNPPTTQVAGQQTADQQVPVEPTVTQDLVKDAFEKSLVKFGNAGSKLVFIEVADPSCPFCHIAAGKNGELNKQVGDRFTLVSDGGTYVAPVEEMKKLVDSKQAAFAWLYTNGHGNGELGTKALYCAHDKGKFWPVHDLLMSAKGYEVLNETVKNDKAKAGELAQFLAPAMNEADMKSCLDSGKYDSRLAEDSSIAAGLGVSGTPGFFVNTVKYAGAYSYKDMEASVTEALK